MLDRFLEEIRNKSINTTQWILGFLGILFVRFILESLSSPTSSGIIPSDPYTLVHYSLFFLSVTLGTIIIVGFFIKNYKDSAKITLFALPIIWIAPILDIVLSQGRGYRMSYIFDSHGQLLFDFFTFFGSNLISGATYGMRIGIILILIGIGWYVWKQTQSVTRTILAVLFSYILGFLVGALPGIMYTISHTNAGTPTDIHSYFQNIISQSTVAHNTLREGVASVSSGRFFELGFDKLMSQILLLISFIFGWLLFRKMEPEKFKSVMGNIRLERINFYIASLFCGIGFAYMNQLGNKFFWTDLLGIACLILSWIGLWMYAVHTNDIADINIDKISNKERPLVKKLLSTEDMRHGGYVWLGLGLLGSWSAGFYPFFMSLMCVATTYIYSSPPLRLRRFPGISAFLISVACLATILAGFFFVSVHKEIYTFPIFLTMGILIMVTLAIQFKDMKDVDGDKQDGVITLLTLFPKNGPKIVGLCFALSILLIPIFLSFYFLYVFALPMAIIGYRLIVKKPYKEKPIFVLRFILLTCIASSYLLIYWLGHLYDLI